MKYPVAPWLSLAWIERIKKRSARVNAMLDTLWGRSPRAFVARVTALLLVFALGIGGYVAVAALNDDSGADRLKKDFEKAIAKSDFEAASSVLESLVRLEPDNRDYRYRLAQTLDKRERNEEAEAIMRDLMASHHAGATLWIAEREFQRGEYRHYDADQHALYRGQLRMAATAPRRSDALRAKNLLSSYLLEMGQWQEALEVLSSVAADQPEANLHAASLCLMHGDPAGAKRFARLAEKHFASQLSLQPASDIVRLHLARSLAFLDREKEALTVLSDGFQRTHQSTLQQAAGETLVLWARRLASQDVDRTSLIARVQLIHRATQCAPGDPAVIAALFALTNECLDRRNDCVEQFRSAIAGGADRESLHFMLGTIAIMEGDLPTAQTHLDLAQRAGSHLPTVLSNLALAQLQLGQLERALALSEVANERLPNQPHLCEVRGRILLKMERCDEAIVELKKGLQAEELKAIVYPSLLVAYEKTGNSVAAGEIQALLD